MARYTLGIYWDNVSLRAGLVKAGISEVSLEKILNINRAHDGDQVPDKGIAPDIGNLLQSIDVAPDTYVAALSENDIMYRSLLRPFGDRRKIADTIGPEVETLLPVMGSSFIMDFVLLGKDDAGLHRIETVSAKQSSVEHLITELKAADIDPEIIDSPSVALAGGARNIFELSSDKSYLFLHMGWQDTSLAVLEGRQLRYVGAFPYGFEKIADSMEQNRPDSPESMNDNPEEGFSAAEVLDSFVREVLISLHRIGSQPEETVLVPLGYAYNIKDLASRFEKAGDILTEIPPLQEIHFDGSVDDLLVNFLPISLACRAIDNADAINFRQADLSFTKRMERIKGYAGVWAKVCLALVLIWIFASGLDVYLKAQVDNELSAKIQQEFSAVMSEGTPMVDPVKQMQQLLGRLSGQSGGVVQVGEDSPLEILRDISAGIPGDIDVVFDNITIDETSLTFSGSTKTYDNVERIKEILSSLSAVSEVKIVTANVDKANQRVNLKLVCKK
jgi:hypothetical protein